MMAPLDKPCASCGADVGEPCRHDGGCVDLDRLASPAQHALERALAIAASPRVEVWTVDDRLAYAREQIARIDA